MKYLFMLIMAISISGNLRAEEVSFGKSVERVDIKWEQIDPSRPSLGLKPTHLRFPKPVYRFDNVTLFRVQAARSKSGQSDYRELKIYPRKSHGEQQVEIVLQDRSVIKVLFQISKSKGVARSYDFKPERVGAKKRPRKVLSSNSSGEMGIMRAILQGQNVSGMSLKSLNNWVRCRGRGLSARVFKIYKGKGFKAFKVRIKNTSSWKTFKINPHEIRFTKRDISKPVLKHIDTEILKPKKSLVLTMLGDVSTSIWKSRICDVGKQATLHKKKKSRGKS